MAWIDNLRVLASFAVVFLHVSVAVIAGTNDYSSYRWWTANIADSMVRWSVPVFVMISGYLLLDPQKEYGLFSFYRKRLNRILVPLLFWSFFYSIWSYLRGDGVRLYELLERILQGQPSFHMWYLYMLMGLYLFTPFIRRVTSGLSNKDLALLCGILFLCAFLDNIVNQRYIQGDRLFISWFLPYLGYFIAGHLIGRSNFQPRNLYLVFVLLVSIIGTAFGCFWFSTRYGPGKGLYFYSYLSLTVIPMSLAMFLLMKKLNQPLINERTSKILASSMLGVYVMHPIFLVLLFQWDVNRIIFSPVLLIPVISILGFGFALLMTLLIARVPYLQKVV